MTTTKIEDWSLGKIRPGKTNPRTDFNEEALVELSESVATHGILQPLVARPDWCIGKSAVEIAQINGDAPAAEFLEIVAGERRYRAALKAKLESVPVSVRLFSDQDVLEIHLIENLQREDLDPFEEADGYRQLLALRDLNSAPVHTIKTICQRVNKTRARVYYRLNLLNVPPSVRAAVRSKGLGVRTAEAIGAIPTKEMRAAAAAEIIKPTDPSYGVGPLTVVQATEFIEANFMRSLSAAQFDQKNAALVPVIEDEQTGARRGGGACTDCPMRTGNMEEIIGKTKRPDVCTNPQCFARKTDAHFARLMESAAADGKEILTEADVAEIFDKEGRIFFDSDYAKLSDQPDRQEVRSDFTGKIPSWKKLIENLKVKPQLYIARDPRGQIVELVNLSLAIEAVNLAAKQKSERSIFDKTPAKAGTSASSSSASGGGSTSGGGLDPFKEQERKNREIAKVNFQVTLAALSAVIAAIDDKGPVAGFWDELIKASITHAGHDGCWLICKRHGLEAELGKRVDGIAGEGVEGAALKYGLTLPDEKMKIGYVVELLISQRVKFSNSGSMGGVRSVKAFTSIAKLYGVDLAAVEKDTREGAKEKKKPDTREGAKEKKKPKIATAPPGPYHLINAVKEPGERQTYGVCQGRYTLDVKNPYMEAGLTKAAAEARLKELNSIFLTAPKLATPKAAIVNPTQLQLEGAYSAPEIAKGTIRQPVAIEGKEYTVSGIDLGGKGEPPIFDLVEFIPAEKFKGKTRSSDEPHPKKGPNGYYHGVAINFHGKAYVLGFMRQYRVPDAKKASKKAVKKRQGLTPAVKKKKNPPPRKPPSRKATGEPGATARRQSRKGGVK